eukprot:1138421-Pelagomonas_calceolata.AAC.7
MKCWRKSWCWERKRWCKGSEALVQGRRGAGTGETEVKCWKWCRGHEALVQGGCCADASQGVNLAL